MSGNVSSVLVGAAAGIAAIVLYQAAAKSRKKQLLKHQLEEASVTTTSFFGSKPKLRSYRLCNVRIPVSNLPEDLTTKGDANCVDVEGLVNCDILVDCSGTISDIRLSCAAPTTTTSLTDEPSVDCQNCILLPCFIDAHTHLTKTQSVPRNPNRTGTMGEALAVEAMDQSSWTNPDLVRRQMDFALQCAQHYGTKAVRTHLDGCESDNALVRDTIYEIYTHMVHKYSKVGITLQGVANLWLPLWLNDELATAHANRAASHPNVVLGVYVGNPDPKERPATTAAIKALLGHAQRLQLDVDLHIDESNDPECCCLMALIDALAEARKEGFQGRVVLGHCCALSLQAKERQEFICQQLAQLKAMVVANPTTNLGLQDRRGSSRPYSVPIDAKVARTPQWRGLTLIQELHDTGVTVAVASDNVRDYWHPYGDYDMLAVWALGLTLGHLDTIPSAGAWSHMANDSPAHAMGLLDDSNQRLLQPGQPADLVLFPSARRISELLARPQVDRIVVRDGRVQTTALPDFGELDDLVSVLNPRPEGF